MSANVRSRYTGDDGKPSSRSVVRVVFGIRLRPEVVEGIKREAERVNILPSAWAAHVLAAAVSRKRPAIATRKRPGRSKR